MPLYTLDAQTDLPQLEKAPEVSVQSETNTSRMAEVTQLPIQTILQRWEAGHRSYIAWVDDCPAAYGWVAGRSATIGELDLSFQLRADHVYLWDFATLPAWRGRGIYPALLQHIVRSEAAHTQHFWIARAPENFASRRGIEAAGFLPVGQLSFLKHDIRPALTTGTKNAHRAEQAAHLFNLALLSGEEASQQVAPCWCCTIAAKQAPTFTPPACWDATCGCTSRETR